MSDEPTLSPAAFGRAFRAFLEQAVREEKTGDPPFVARLADHLDADPRELPILTEQFSVIEHPNVRAALDAWISVEDRSAASPRAETPNHQASSTTPATSRGTGSPSSVNEA